MPIEHASVRVAHKPWGVGDLRPWSSIDGTDHAVGELCFERADKNASIPTLLLKLLFTNEPLSIQVHPDDTFARAIGMPNGKSEAWYIISAKPDAKIGVGLKYQVTPQELRAAIRDGSIVDLVQWRPVAKGDVIFIPADGQARERRGWRSRDVRSRPGRQGGEDLSRRRDLRTDSGSDAVHGRAHRSADAPVRRRRARRRSAGSRGGRRGRRDH